MLQKAKKNHILYAILSYKSDLFYIRMNAVHRRKLKLDVQCCDCVKKLCLFRIVLTGRDELIRYRSLRLG